MADKETNPKKQQEEGSSTPTATTIDNNLDQTSQTNEHISHNLEKSESSSSDSSNDSTSKNGNNNNNNLRDSKGTVSSKRHSGEVQVNPPCSEDIYHKLPLLKVLQLRNSKELGNLTGPDSEEREALFKDGKVASALISSTYPHIDGTDRRAGDPICDVFSLKLYDTHSLLAVADGCNWGERSREAAIRACKAFMEYLRDHQSEITDVPEAGHLLLRAFDKASREITVGKDDIWEAGTTTLLGGISLELEADKWCFLCVNVGDCKAFRWAQKTQEVTDITVGNRRSLTDARDPGGRLGPYLEHGAPDLRNLKLYYAECLPGDIIFVVSDGVHDNYDPQLVGKPPGEFGIQAATWEEAEREFPQESEAAKTAYRKRLMEETISSSITTSGKEVKPKHITRKLIDYCKELTQNGRQWMEQNPNKKLPSDYVTYPGKMDHVTCVSLRIGQNDDDDTDE